MEDPARVVSCFAGVANTPGGNSDIIVRGNSPKYMQWRLEGNEISSPYHLDDQNSSYGALTVLNNNLLATSDFYTGAFSAEYGDVISSVYDVKLRTGNNERFEACAGIGIMGTDLTAEGPFRKGYSGSYLVNYRFSNIALIKKLGLVDVEGGVNYQDATFKIVLPTKKNGTFSLYGLGGKSGVSMENIGPDGLSTPGSELSSALISKDFNKSNYLLNVGVNHFLPLGEKSNLRTSLTYSVNGASDDVYQRDTIKLFNVGGEFTGDSISDRTHTIRSRIVYSVVRASAIYSHKINKSNKIQAGIQYALNSFNNALSQYSKPDSSMVVMNDFRANLASLNTFVNWKHSFSDRFTLVAGLHNLNLLKHGISTIEPRISVNWILSKKGSLHAGYGMHSTMERIITITPGSRKPTAVILNQIKTWGC